MTIIRTLCLIIISFYTGGASCSDNEEEIKSLEQLKATIEEAPVAKPAQPILKRQSGPILLEEVLPEVVVEQLPAISEAERREEMEGLKKLQDELFKSANTSLPTPASRREARHIFKQYAVGGEDLDSVDSVESSVTESVE